MITKLWPVDQLRRLIHLMGILVFAGTYAVGVYFFIEEAPIVWEEGLGFFLIDLFVRLGFGLLFALIAVLPYYIGSVSAKRTSLPMLFFVVCLITFALDIWLRVDVIFFPVSSTASIALIYAPFYLSVPVLLVWAVVAGGKAIFNRGRDT